MARFQNELENLQSQQKEAVERLQSLEADSSKLRELILKLQGAIEVLQALEEQGGQSQAGATDADATDSEETAA